MATSTGSRRPNPLRRAIGAIGRSLGVQPPWLGYPAGMRDDGYCYLGDGRAVARTHRGHLIYLDTADIGIAPHIATTGVWEWHVEAAVMRLLRPGQHVVEVGANMGYHTLAMAQAIGPAGRLDAFEPSPRAVALLRASIAVNGYADRIRLHPVAALDRAREITLHSEPNNIGSGHWNEAGASPSYSLRDRVRAVTLDAALAGTAPIDLLRMDAEGSEPEVLRGAEVLLHASPGLRIVTEWAPDMLARRHDLGALVRWMAGFGFHCWRIGPDSRLEPVAAAALPGLPHGELLLARSNPAG